MKTQYALSTQKKKWKEWKQYESLPLRARASEGAWVGYAANEGWGAGSSSGDVVFTTPARKSVCLASKLTLVTSVTNLFLRIGVPMVHPAT